MKIAVFLDVDKTITKKSIQEVYASELGLSAAFDHIERDFQDKKIDAAEFGIRLISLFAGKAFTRTRAEDFFGKVELRDGVDKLFSYLDRGVDIFLVSSGPNYYIDVLAQRRRIPANRILSSRYLFDDRGLICKCYAAEDQDKVQFVVKNRGGYDITIGIGDNDRHDQFVDVCTISMFMEPNQNYIHVPHFNAVSTLIEGLLSAPRAGGASEAQADSVTLDTLKTVNIKTAVSRFSVGLWMVLVGIVLSAFTLGASEDWLKALLGPPGKPAAVVKAPRPQHAP